MTDYWLSKAAEKLRAQVDARWAGRDKSSDGWVGDTSHAARESDHNPCWSCAGDRYGVVRAIDIDADLDKADPGAAQRLANQLVECAKAGEDGKRLSYVIFNRRIASGSSSSAYWTWRPYNGENTHEHHIHVSFKPLGDFRDAAFPLRIFRAPLIARLRDAIRTLSARIGRLATTRRRARRRLDDLTN